MSDYTSTVDGAAAHARWTGDDGSSRHDDAPSAGDLARQAEDDRARNRTDPQCLEARRYTGGDGVQRIAWCGLRRSQHRDGHRPGIVMTRQEFASLYGPRPDEGAPF